MTLGRLPEGLRLYESRWLMGADDPPPIGPMRKYNKPLWLGRSDIVSKTILVRAEQGLGDEIQFCRYAPLAAKAGARVILESRPELFTPDVEPLRRVSGHPQRRSPTGSRYPIPDDEPATGVRHHGGNSSKRHAIPAPRSRARRRMGGTSVEFARPPRRRDMARRRPHWPRRICGFGTAKIDTASIDDAPCRHRRLFIRFHSTRSRRGADRLCVPRHDNP